MIVPAYTLSVLAMILLPVALAGLARWRFRPAWILFSIGILTFGLSQAVHLPLNNWLTRSGWLPANLATASQPLWRSALTLGLTAGVCEELARVLGYALLQRFPGLRSQSTPGGLMLGLGHGGIESMVFGGLLTTASLASLVGLMNADLSMLNLSPEQLEAVQWQLSILTASPFSALLPVIERILAMGLHVTLSLLVLQAFKRRQAGWVGVSIAYHTLVNAILVILAANRMNAWLIEGILFLLCLPGYLWLAHQYQQTRATPAQNTAGRELRILGTAVVKEIHQQVRTRQWIIIMIVFGLFGMLSPLLAYLTPELFKMIPGAETFSDLIPPPTAGDAMLQFHKNLTQFGIILVLLVGMGAVAREKESGAAGLILSKPLMRWAYLLSKLLAQNLMLACGLLAAMLGAYVYTAYLFGPPDLVQFGAMNLILLAWLAPYTALVLLGSVLGGSTASAAGMGLAGMAALLGLSSLPPLAPILPGALSAWAAGLGSRAAGVAATTPGAVSISTPAPAALAMALILVVCIFLVTLGVFEQQEL